MNIHSRNYRHPAAGRRSQVLERNNAGKKTADKNSDEQTAETAVQGEQAEEQLTGAQGTGSGGDGDPSPPRPKVANYIVSEFKFPALYTLLLSQNKFYYEEKIRALFDLSITDNDEYDHRLNKYHQLERDAVYAKALALFDPYPATNEKRTVAIEPEPGTVVYYEMDYKAPVPVEGAGEQKPSLAIRFKGKRSGAEQEIKKINNNFAQDPDARNKIQEWIMKPEDDKQDFSYPDVNGKGTATQEAYFKKETDEKDKLYDYLIGKYRDYIALQEKAPDPFDIRDIVHTGKATYYIQSTFIRDPVYPKSRKDFRVRDLKINYIAAGSGTIPVEKPLNDKSKTFRDYSIELLQRQASVASNNRLGNLYGLESISDELEREAVKYCAETIFLTDHTNETVTQPVPIDRKGESKPEDNEVYYYKFTLTKPRKSLDADYNVVDIYVDRIGKKGDQQGDVADPYKIRIEDTYGFSANSATEKAFRDWIKTRYASIQLPAEGSLADLIAFVNAEMNKSAGTKEWFKTTYGITVYDRSEALSEYLKISGTTKTGLKPNYRLEENPATIDKTLKDPQKSIDAAGKNIKNFSDDELRVIELSLQKMTPAMLNLLRSASMIRENEIYEKSLSDGNFNAAGLTIPGLDGKYAILIDNGGLRISQDFYGGKGGETSPSTVHTPTHELGHILAMKNNSAAEANFNKFISKYKIIGPTDYSRQVNPAKNPADRPLSSPESEFFPESFAIYVHDPEWMQQNRVGEFAWFEAFAKEGKPPSLTDPALNKLFQQEYDELFK